VKPEVKVGMRTPTRTKKIENVTDGLVRFRIEQIVPKSARMCTKYLYLIDGRVSEGVSRAYKSDTKTTPRGPVGTDAKIDLYYPPEYTSIEEAYKAQEEDGFKRVHPCVVFKVATAKRRGRPRYCSLPLDPKMEPWAQEMAKYFADAGDDFVFPLTRQDVYRRAKKFWRDLAYVIEDYSVVIDKEGTITGIDKEKRRSKRVDRHLRDFTLHALRHLRASDLVDYYDFNGANLSAFGGWTVSTAMRVGSSVGRYLDLQWQGYFPKLLRKRY
jgi:hypothetical protein